eukprot:TRINITY_DN1569_c0_g1_i2.p1 TRINITY_DN1569_c0_g1~~TRINITY_DN1569_c0_g1_i2.p1  ORF type:complete len:1162 (+),score=259.39 TRINITY_DN1569_c0_g1_i2:266-3487(+)
MPEARPRNETQQSTVSGVTATTSSSNALTCPQGSAADLGALWELQMARYATNGNLSDIATNPSPAGESLEPGHIASGSPTTPPGPADWKAARLAKFRRLSNKDKSPPTPPAPQQDTTDASTADAPAPKATDWKQQRLERLRARGGSKKAEDSEQKPAEDAEGGTGKDEAPETKVPIPEAPKDDAAEAPEPVATDWKQQRLERLRARSQSKGTGEQKQQQEGDRRPEEASAPAGPDAPTAAPAPATEAEGGGPAAAEGESAEEEKHEDAVDEAVLRAPSEAGKPRGAAPPGAGADLKRYGTGTGSLSVWTETEDSADSLHMVEGAGNASAAEWKQQRLERLRSLNQAMQNKDKDVEQQQHATPEAAADASAGGALKQASSKWSEEGRGAAEAPEAPTAATEPALAKPTDAPAADPTAVPDRKQERLRAGSQASTEQQGTPEAPEVSPAQGPEGQRHPSTERAATPSLPVIVPQPDASAATGGARAAEPGDMATLTIEAVRAEDIPAGDITGTSDAYAVFLVPGFAPKRTPVMKKTLNPVWMHDMQFDLARADFAPDGELVCQVWVYDEDFINDDFLCSTVLRITPDLRRRARFKDVDMRLDLASGQGAAAGVLVLRVGTRDGTRETSSPHPRPSPRLSLVLKKPHRAGDDEGRAPPPGFPSPPVSMSVHVDAVAIPTQGGEKDRAAPVGDGRARGEPAAPVDWKEERRLRVRAASEAKRNSVSNTPDVSAGLPLPVAGDDDLGPRQETAPVVSNDSINSIRPGDGAGVARVESGGSEMKPPHLPLPGIPVVMSRNNSREENTLAPSPDVPLATPQPPTLVVEHTPPTAPQATPSPVAPPGTMRVPGTAAPAKLPPKITEAPQQPPAPAPAAAPPQDGGNPFHLLRTIDPSTMRAAPALASHGAATPREEIMALQEKALALPLHSELLIVPADDALLRRAERELSVRHRKEQQKVHDLEMARIAAEKDKYAARAQAAAAERRAMERVIQQDLRGQNNAIRDEIARLAREINDVDTQILSVRDTTVRSCATEVTHGLDAFTTHLTECEERADAMTAHLLSLLAAPPLSATLRMPAA